VPEHWEVKRAKTILRCIDVRSLSGEEELLTVSSERGVIPRSTATVTMFKAESYQGYKLCWPGDLVINSLWAWARGLGVSRYHGIVSSAYSVYRPRVGHEAYSSFIHELVRSIPFQWELQVRSKGIWISRLQLTDESFLNAPIPIVPLTDQTAIARYLDHADRKVRHAIRARQQLIKLLMEQKQAIIQRAVTRGLEPNVRLKPSGVPWLGDVPEHWDVARLKSTLVRNDSGCWGSDFSASGSLVLRSNEQTLDGTWQIVAPARRLLSSKQQNESRLAEGDLVITKSSGSSKHIGKTSLVTPEIAAMGCCFSNFMQRIRLDATVNPKLAWYWLNSQVGRGQLVYESNTTTGLANLNGKIIGNLFFGFPPLAEQAAIVKHLDGAMVDLDRAIDAAHREIDLLREYRTCLIADVVTGKLDVRDAAAHLPDEPEEQQELLDEEPADETGDLDAEASEGEQSEDESKDA
jgi:type I restriction enzyme S subunit